MSQSPLLRVVLTAGPSAEISDLIRQRWERLEDGPFPDAWTLLDSGAGAAVLSRHQDYAFDATLAADASKPDRRAWLIDLTPSPTVSSWRANKIVKATLDQGLSELGRHGLGLLEEMLRRGGGHVAVRVDGLETAEREAIRAELRALPGWEIAEVRDAVVARGPDWAQTERWSSRLARTRRDATVSLFWRPRGKAPSVIEDHAGKLRVWYPPEVKATPAKTERVDRLFGAGTWPDMMTATRIPRAWFPDIPEHLR